MASVVTLCNLALSHLGDRANLTSIDPPEGSAQADHCANFWPIARDTALSARDWRFASIVVSPARYEDTVPGDPRWQYAYAPPADMLVAREFIFDDGSSVWLEDTSFGAPQYELGLLPDTRKALFANYADLSLRYTRKVTDPTQYPIAFATALTYLLASYLAGPVIKGRAGVGTAEAMWKRWEIELGKATVTDANQNYQPNVFTPAGVRARNAALPGSTVQSGPYRRELPFWAEG